MKYAFSLAHHLLPGAVLLQENLRYNLCLGSTTASATASENTAGRYVILTYPQISLKQG